MKRFVLLTIIAFVAAALGCAHSNGATAVDKTNPADSTVSAADTKAPATKGDAAAQKSKEQDRQKILAMKDLTLAELYKLKPETKEIIEKAEGYAVFDATGVFVVLYVGIAGRGVLIDKSNGEATYMTMGRAGTGPGVGYQKFRSILVFKNRKLMETFKAVGGDIGASGHLVVKGFGKGGGVGGEVSFDPMLSTYQITTHGLAAEASWGATVFAPDAILN